MDWLSDGERSTEGTRAEAGVVRRGRLRWFRVRVETDDGAYVGSLRLSAGSTALHDLMNAGRAYLPLWRATEQRSGVEEEFIAIHKSAIRAVVLVGAADAGSSRPRPSCGPVSGPAEALRAGSGGAPGRAREPKPSNVCRRSDLRRRVC